MNSPYKQTNKSDRGFTIIEVVLVLAIAGLIFLMVFLALPALQRGQRDAQRRDDVARVVSQLTSYKTNNKGNVPETANFGTFITNYLRAGGDSFVDPQTGDPYTVSTVTDGSGLLTVGTVQYMKSAECNGENISTITTGGTRKAAVRMKLEGSGHFCQNV